MNVVTGWRLYVSLGLTEPKSIFSEDKECFISQIVILWQKNKTLLLFVIFPCSPSKALKVWFKKYTINFIYTVNLFNY